MKLYNATGKPIEPGFYVTCIDDGVRGSFVAGPFETHEVALSRVEPERERWYELDGRTWFMAWGTARVPQ